MALIAIEGLKIRGYVGVHEEEKILGNDYSLDIYITSLTQLAEEQDTLNDTIDYEQVALIAKKVLSQPANLLEHALQKVIKEIAVSFKNINHIKARLSKLHPPISGEVKRVYVEISRDFH